jgi:hypothetical protein
MQVRGDPTLVRMASSIGVSDVILTAAADSKRLRKESGVWIGTAGMTAAWRNMKLQY